MGGFYCIALNVVACLGYMLEVQVPNVTEPACRSSLLANGMERIESGSAD